jgi:hypothetical protein
MEPNETSLKADLNPIKRVWKAKAAAAQPARRPGDLDGNERPDYDGVENIAPSVWDFCKELQATETERLSRSIGDGQGVHL